MQKVELFKPEDFEGTYGHFQKEAHAKFAEIANKKLQKYIDSCPVAYFKYLGGKPFNLGPELNENDDTHTARLAFIEELPKEKCNHEAHVNIYLGVSSRVIESTCKHCGVKLRVEWKEVI